MTDIPRDIPLSAWLPASRAEMAARGWDQADVIVVTGDAYVDHPAFGTAIVGRLLESLGLRVAILPQPNWQDDLRDFRKLGAPRLFFAVTAGCMDSMVNHYTANRRRRSDDAYTPGGRAGRRPDRAVTVYSSILKRLYPQTPVVIGGIEASLRRITHYDFWSDSLRPTVLAESGADLLIYGMGEEPLTRLVRLLERGVPFARIDTLPQSAILRPEERVPVCRAWNDFVLHAHEDCLRDARLQAENFARIEQESNLWQSRTRFLQRVDGQVLVLNPPEPLPEQRALDHIYDLPYTRFPHPRYRNRGAIPAFEAVKHSVTMHRGCFGGCSFCTISAHQGKFIASRSPASILREVERVTEMPGFAGTITDLGGPSANMYGMGGKKPEICRRCRRPSCLHPEVCANLDTRHQPLLEIYRAVTALPKVRHLQIGSGLRYDLFLHPTDDPELAADHQAYFEQLVSRHVSGRLKVAPEHTADSVLQLMRKPGFDLFLHLKERFEAVCRKKGLKLQLVPYMISGHPGCGIEEMAELALTLKRLGYRLEQVQLFTPTPMTLATEMFACGLDPFSQQKLKVARDERSRRDQHRLFFWYLAEERERIGAVLRRVGLEKTAARLLGDRSAVRRPKRNGGRRQKKRE
ncbi:putative radical SAM protein YgiQ [Geothermobacter ehrlichii]|uniref:Putative radical SAM protein YgiQ n=1 Tax=Geothermobacter ehrlichii TaxID=213224 RepID=A0A5D3WMV6_9BACT|nr:YgiQ family radical SAM protein [Geothermobacter ehrlichii]TYO99891.1 putative radical SAM protein YgiQ [Geothermobacter ehrlichii]